MKTLDEVIEIASDWTNGFDEMSIEKQMLHYLKMYRSDQIQWEADRKDWQDKWESYIEARERHLDAVKELKRNDPLSWDELKQMEGKPVWIEIFYPVMEDEIGATEDEGEWKGYWALRSCRKNKFLVVENPREPLYETDYGKTWKAYRKERD